MISVAKIVPPVSGAKTISTAKGTPTNSVTMITPVSPGSVPNDMETDELEIISISKHDSFPLRTILHNLKSKKHSVYGDGSCLYHAIAHQAGFIDVNSKGCKIISGQLRRMVLKVMSEYPAVRLEDGLSSAQWLERQQVILNAGEWGGDLEVRLLAIGLKRDILVLTSTRDDASYARRFPCEPPPIPKMKGGIFIPLTANQLCEHWTSSNPHPLLVIYNSHSHYDSTVQVDN